MARRKISGREAIRRQGFRLLRRGVPKSRIASMLGVERVTVWRWEQRMEKEGPHAWSDRKIPGGPRKINGKQRKRLREILLEGALAHGYATDLNPDEMVWSALKYQRLPNFCPKTEEEIRKGVESELRWLQRHPDFVASCIQHAEIPLVR